MKKMTAMMLTAAMIGSLTACGGGTEKEAAKSSAADASSGTESEARQTAEAPAGEKVNIRILTYETSSNAVEEAVAPFMEANPGITVEVVAATDFTAMNTNAIAAHQANDDYDVMFVNHVDTLSYIQGGVIRSIQEYIDRDGVDYGEILFASLLEQGQSGGETYALPANTGTRVLAVNRDLFDKYQVEVPATQEEMLKAAEALTVDDNFGYVSPLCENCYSPTYEQGMYLASNGGRLYEIGEDGKATATINTQEMKQFLTFMTDLLPYMPKDSLTMTGDDARKAFASGNIAMYKYGNWELEQMPETDFNCELYLVPEGSAGRISTSGGFQLAMGGGTEHPEEAWQLIKYLTTTQEAMSKMAGTDLPVMEACYDTEPYNDAKYDIFNEQLENAVLTGIPVTNMNEVSEKFFSYWCDLLYGKITADEMCEEAQASVQELLDKNNK